jgi:hypothetical protein
MATRLEGQFAGANEPALDRLVSIVATRAASR